MNDIPMLVVSDDVMYRGEKDFKGVGQLGYVTTFIKQVSGSLLEKDTQEQIEDRAIAAFRHVIKTECFVMVLSDEESDERGDDEGAQQMFAMGLLGAAILANKRVVVIGDRQQSDMLLFYPAIDFYPSVKSFIKEEKANA